MPRPKKGKVKPYSHDVKRFVEIRDPCGDRREEIRTFTIYPSKMSTYALGMTIKKGILSPEEEPHYQDSFMARVEDYIWEACDDKGLDAKKFIPVFRNNIDYVVSWTLQRVYEKENYQLISGNRFVPGCRARLDAEQKETNRAIFVMRLRDTIHSIAKMDRITNVCEDYATVQEVLADPSRFENLERLCFAPLDYFVNCRKIGGIDSESQRQEGRLAIWKAAHNYKATRFARFSSFARGALNFKFKNMLTATMAMKRKVNRNLVTMGGTVNGQDSFFTHLLDRMALENWQQQQAVYDALDENRLGIDFALSQIHPDDVPERVDFENNIHVRNLSPSEINSDILNLNPNQRRLHYKQKVPLELFDTKVMTSHTERQPPRVIFTELSNEYFPHMNENELSYDSNESVLAKYRDEKQYVPQENTEKIYAKEYDDDPDQEEVAF